MQHVTKVVISAFGRLAIAGAAAVLALTATAQADAGPPPPCGSGGDCFRAHRAPGCDVIPCCGTVCELDPFCCNTSWDQACAELAGAFCPAVDPCMSSDHDCFTIGAAPGCSDATCCNKVCAADPFCCAQTWDGFCVAAADLLCPPETPDLNIDGFVNAGDLAMLLGAWGTPGPGDFDFNGFVGASDLGTLLGAWTLQPSGTTCPGVGACFTAHKTPGCSSAACCNTVCAADPACCQAEWDALCAGRAFDMCDPCGDCINGQYCDPQGNPTCCINPSNCPICYPVNDPLSQALCGCCCQYQFVLYNSLPNVQKVAIVASNPLALLDLVNGNPSDWSAVFQAPNSYIITPKPAFSNFPNFPVAAPPPAEAEGWEEDFILRVDCALAPTVVQVVWYGPNNQVLKTEQMTLKCLPENIVEGDGFEDDWETNRTLISGMPDGACFSGLAQIPCDEEFGGDPEGQSSAKMAAGCLITPTYTCVNNVNTLTLTPSPDPGGPGVPSWHWVITNTNGTTPVFDKTYADAQAVPYSLTMGIYDVMVELYFCKTINNADGSQTINCEYCSITQNICLVRPEFTKGKPKPTCPGNVLTGFDVEFTPKSLACPLTDYVWNFGDGSAPVPATSATVTKHYGIAAQTYQVTLEAKDTNHGGCKHVSDKQSVKITTSCDPTFEASYVWCKRDGVPADIEVTFENTSQEFCDPQFSWDFGAGFVPAVGTTTTHTFTGMQESGQSKLVKLKMVDSVVCPNGVIVSAMILIKPLSLNLNATACDDGKLFLEAANDGDDVRFVWSLPPGCFYEETTANIKNLLKSDNTVECNPNEGNGLVASVKGTETKSLAGGKVQQHRSCSTSATFNIRTICYHNLIVKGNMHFQDGSATYRIKWDDSVRRRHDSIITGHHTHVKGKTTFQKKRKVLGINFWLAKKAFGPNQEVSAYSNHTFRANSGSLCNCDILTSVGNGSRFRTSGHHYRAKFNNKNKNIGEREIHRDTLFQVTHVVVHHGVNYTVVVQKAVGDEWNTFTPSPNAEPECPDID